jgi:hypothetical protein
MSIKHLDQDKIHFLFKNNMLTIVTKIWILSTMQNFYKQALFFGLVLLIVALFRLL